MALCGKNDALTAVTDKIADIEKEITAKLDSAASEIAGALDTGLQELEKEQLDKLRESKQIPDFAPGDTVRVNVKISEGTRERVQAYEGVVIGRSGSGINESFTVRKISYGEGVERVFPVYSPTIESISVVKKVR